MIGPLIGVIVLIAVVVFYNRRGIAARGGGAYSASPKKNCQWIATGDPEKRLREYRCETCGVTGYSATGNPPVECKQNLRLGN